MRRNAMTRRGRIRRGAVTTPWRHWATDVVLLIGLLAALAVLLLYAAASPPTRMDFTIDQPITATALRYFYPVERSSTLTYRWAEPRATIQLPVTRPGTYRITFVLLNGALPPRTATITDGEQQLVTVTLDSTARDVVFEATITPQEWKDDPQHSIDLTLDVPAAWVGADPRPLGAMLTRVVIVPEVMPAPWQPALLLPDLLLLLTAYGVLRCCGTAPGIAAGIGGATLAAYAVFVALARLRALALGYTLALDPVRPLVVLGLLAVVLVGIQCWLRHATSHARSRLVWGAWITAAYAIVTVVLTWPLALRLNTATATGADPPLQLWIARWVQHALVTDPGHLYDANVFYPYPTTLAYSDADIPMALLHWPLYLLIGDDLVAFNLLMLGTFVLAATGMYALAWRLTRNRGAAFVTGLAFAFLPARFAHLSHLQQLSHAWTPWVVLALLSLLARQRWLGSLILGLALAVVALCSFYLAAQLLCVVGTIVLVALIADHRSRTWRSVSRLAAAGVVALAFVLPVAWPYLTLNSAQGFERRIEESTQAGRSATLDSYRRVSDGTPSWGGLLPPVEDNSEDILYPSGVVLLGALVGIVAWRRRRLVIAFLLLGVVAFVLSLGPTLALADGASMPLPYGVLYAGVPLFKALRVPARFGTLADFALVALAVGGMATGWRWLARRLHPLRRRALAPLVTGFLAIAVLAETAAAPIPLDPLDRSPETTAPYRWLASQRDNGAILDLPVYFARYSRATLMYWSTYHWHPLVEGYSGFLPPNYWERLSPFTHDLARPNGTTSRAVAYVDDGTIGLVRDLGVRYIVFHRSDYHAEDWPLVLAALERTGAAERAHVSDDTVIYRLK